jgi:hypothetical protein
VVYGSSIHRDAPNPILWGLLPIDLDLVLQTDLVWIRIWICFLEICLDLDLFFSHLGLIQIYSDIFRLGFGFDASIWIRFGFDLDLF